MKGKISLALFCSSLFLAGCSSTPDQTRLLPTHAMEPDVNAPMDEVALANCNDMGGMPTTLHNLDGSKIGKCVLSNGKRF